MKKTPSVFPRNPEDMHRVLLKPNPDAQWVFDGLGVATRKYDGTCVMLDAEGDWWARREVKKDKLPPENWVELDADPITGKRMGWEPIEQSGYNKALVEAVNHWDNPITPRLPDTYELCGPKVNGNPEHFDEHVLVHHKHATVLREPGGPRTVDGIIDSISVARDLGWEGLVWHHPDGRMAKLKVRDLHH